MYPIAPLALLSLLCLSPVCSAADWVDSVVAIETRDMTVAGNPDSIVFSRLGTKMLLVRYKHRPIAVKVFNGADLMSFFALLRNAKQSDPANPVIEKTMRIQYLDGEAIADKVIGSDLNAEVFAAYSDLFRD